MKFSNNDVLKVVRQAMEQSIKPELTSRDAQAAYDTIVLGLGELMKRETRTAGSLDTFLPEGYRIAKVLTEHLRALDAAHAETLLATIAKLQDSAQPGNVVSGALQYNTLLDLMEECCSALSSAENRGTAAGVVLREAALWELDVEKTLRRPLGDIDYDNDLQSGALSIDALRNFLRSTSETNATCEVLNLERIPGGMSKETYFFDLESESGTIPLVVRKSDPKPALTEGIFDLRQEFDLVSTLHDCGFIVPHPRWLGYQQADIDGTFYITDRAIGTVAGSVFGAKGGLPESMLLDLASQMASLHTIPLEKFTAYIRKYETAQLLEYDVSACIEYYLQWWHNYWQTFDRVHSPAEVYLFDWLFSRVPQVNKRPSLIHGDLSLHNFLYEGDKLTAILDWEGSHFGDPAEDLAYAKRHVEQHMDWERFVTHYHACGGPEIDQSSFAYYDCLANTRNLIATNKVATRIKHRDTNDTKDLYLALEFLPEFMEVALTNSIHTNR